MKMMIHGQVSSECIINWFILEYNSKQNKKIENAYQKKQKTLKLDDTYSINFEKLIQHRRDDEYRQRSIKRIEVESNSSDEEKVSKRTKRKASEE
jgi:hypothetical protein